MLQNIVTNNVLGRNESRIKRGDSYFNFNEKNYHLKMWKSNLCWDRGRGLRALSIFDAMVSHPAAVVKSIVAKSSILTTGLRTYIVTLRSIRSVVACHHWNAVVFIFASPTMKLSCSTFDGGSRRGIKALSCAIVSHPTSVFINSTIAPLLSVIICHVTISLILVAARRAHAPAFIPIRSDFSVL